MNRTPGKGIYLLAGSTVALLLALIFVFVRGSVASRDNRRISDLNQLAHALSLYTDATGTTPKGCEWSTDSCWKDFLAPHIKPAPHDPVSRAQGDCTKVAGCLVYRYCRVGESGKFILAANLETPPRNPMGNNPKCSLGGPNQYWVTN